MDKMWLNLMGCNWRRPSFEKL